MESRLLVLEISVQRKTKQLVSSSLSKFGKFKPIAKAFSVLEIKWRIALVKENQSGKVGENFRD